MSKDDSFDLWTFDDQDVLGGAIPSRQPSLKAMSVWCPRDVVLCCRLFPPHEFSALGPAGEQALVPSPSCRNKLEIYEGVVAACQEGSVDLVALLLKNIVTGTWKDVEVDVNAMTDDDIPRWTPLTAAVGSYKPKIVALLLDHPSILPNTRDGAGETALTRAAASGYMEVIKILLRDATGLKINLKNTGGYTALQVAAENRFWGVTDFLLGHPDIKLVTPTKADNALLFFVASKGPVSTMRILLQREEVDANSKTEKSEQTLLMLAAAARSQTEIVKLLLEKGGSVNHQDRYGQTPLFHAACYNHIDAVKMLLDVEETDVNMRDIDESSPLWIAASTGYIEVVKLLLSHPKIDTEAKNVDDLDATATAAQHGHDAIVSLLRFKGSNQASPNGHEAAL
jgi:ankyrin repeat protein